MKNSWGLLGSETMAGERRTRTLGLGTSVRLFNELAVPGLGGVWFGKQVFLATLGIEVAEKACELGARVTNIETANAIEAIACWLALKSNGWARDDRLRGNTKMQGKSDLSFKTVRQRNFYVTQPMRMATVQALPALGLVDANGARFNAFICSQAGQDFVGSACEGFFPFNSSVISHLAALVCGKENRVNTDELRGALSPIEPLPRRALDLLQERLIQGSTLENPKEKQRRRDVLAWAEVLRTTQTTQLSWDAKPSEISSTEHWNDLHAGALFFSTRDAAIQVLDTLEVYIGNQGEQRFSLEADVPENIVVRIEELKRAAEAFLSAQHSDKDSNAFCQECISKDKRASLKSLVKRDGRVLRTNGKEVRPGPAFRGTQPPDSNHNENPEDDSPTVASGIAWPKGISYRIRNLFLLNLDLHGELDSLLKASPVSKDDQ